MPFAIFNEFRIRRLTSAIEKDGLGITAGLFARRCRLFRLSNCGSGSRAFFSLFFSHKTTSFLGGGIR